MLALLLASLDQTIVATALPSIVRELGGLYELSWVVTAYLLASTVSTPLWGKLGDLYGRKRVFQGAIAIFLVGSALCGLSQNLWQLILFRGLQGLGGGGLISLAQTIIGDIVAPRERGRYQAYIAGVFVSSSLAGPVLGGFIAEHLHWSWIFWVNLPLCGVAYLLTHNVLQHLPRHERPHQLDLFGAALMVAAAIALMLALTWGGRRYGWSSLPILSLFGASSALWLMFGWRVFTTYGPFIPLAVLRDGAMRAGTGTAFFAVGTVIALTIMLPLYAQVALGLSVSESAGAIIALQGAATVTSILAGRLIARLVHYKRVPLAGLVLAIVALVPLALMPTGLPPPVALALIALVGLGLGPTFPFTVVVVQNAVALHQLGIATGAMNFFRALGSTFIVTGFGALVLAGAPAVRGGVAPASLAGSEAGQAFGLVFAAAIICLAIALACVIALTERPLRGRSSAVS